MPLLYPDILVHSNPNNALVDSNFIKGATRSAVSNLTELYQLSAKGEAGSLGQLKDFATKVWVRSEGKYYTLINEASARNSFGWATDNQLLSAVINNNVFNTTARFVSAFDSALTTNYLTKAENSFGINESIVYDDGNNVGIGETSPEGKLHVKAGSSGSVTAQPNSVGVFENSGNSYISVLSPNSQYAGLVMGGPGNPYGSYVSWNHDNSALKVATAHSGGAIQLLVNAEQEAVRILSGGNVGIGTTNPREKLTISGNLSSSGTATIGTIATNNANTSFVVESNGLLQKRTLNIAAGNTTATFVSASDGFLTTNYLTKATNSNGIDESIISDNGSLVYVGGNLTISGNLTALGNSYFANTLFTTTSSISVVNYGPGPAIYAYQSSGNQDIASFYDGDGVEVLHVGNCPPGELYGKVGINESDPNKELTVKGSVSASGTLNLGTINTNAASDSIVVLGTNNILEKRTIDSRAWGSSLVDGSGTTNYVAKWTDANTIANSQIFDDGTNVGIGTSIPGYLLDVYKDSDVWHTKIGGNTGLLRIGGQTNSGAVIQSFNPSTNAARDLYLQRDGGNVGIGTTSPSEKLDVSGNLKTSGTATIGTIATGTADSVLIESSGLIQKRTIDSRAWGSSLVDGSGTANRVAYWTDSNTIAADSDFFFDGTNVGIGTISPGVKLDVEGTVAVNYLRCDATDGVNEGGEIQLKGAGANGDAQIDNHAGNVRIYTLGASNHFQILGGGSTTALRVENGGAYIGSIATGTTNSVIIESSGTLQKRSIDSRAWGSSLVDGSGTTNYVAKWTDADTITNSQIFDNGTNVGVGTASPGVKLDVNGVIRSNNEIIGSGLGWWGQARYISGNYGVIHRNDGTDYYILKTASGDQYGGWDTSRPFVVNLATGNVGIGSTADISHKLSVTGNIKSTNVIIPGSSTVTPAATTALPASNDVILNNQTGPVTITAFSNGVAGATYTITNKSTHAVTLDTSASLFVRGGNSWASHKCTTNSEGYIVLPQNFSCSLRMDSATIGSAW